MSLCNITCGYCGHSSDYDHFATSVKNAPSVYDFALVAGTRRAETRPFVAQGVAFQNGPQGNALSNFQPNGKIIKKNFLYGGLFNVRFLFLCPRWNQV